MNWEEDREDGTGCGRAGAWDAAHRRAPESAPGANDAHCESEVATCRPPAEANEFAAGKTRSPPSCNTVHFVYLTCYIGLTTSDLESPWRARASFGTKGTGSPT